MPPTAAGPLLLAALVALGLTVWGIMRARLPPWPALAFVAVVLVAAVAGMFGGVIGYLEQACDSYETCPFK